MRNLFRRYWDWANPPNTMLGFARRTTLLAFVCVLYAFLLLILFVVSFLI